jgi:two-component system CheB/CheR fusion protein
MFRQADAGLNRRHAGMGIGLALVKQLVELHDGSVEAGSEGPGKGARFIIRLPLLDGQHPIPDANLLGPELPALKSMTILVVDDSEDTVEMLRFALEGSHALVITAGSGEEALRLASEKKFDVILSDISMPGMDGFELLSRLRALPTNQQTPVLALTGFGRAEDIKQAESVGFAAHFTKPLNLEGLACILSTLVPPTS